MMQPLIPHTHNRGTPPPVLRLPDTARSMGIYVLGGKGSGKSRLLGRVMAVQDCLRGVSQVVWDAAGSLIDNFLDKINRLPPAKQQAVWPRVRYVEMSGHFGRIVPWPLYTRDPRDTLYTCAQRYLEVVRRLDPHLLTASVEGYNALAEVGTAVGMVLTALGGQITEADHLLSHPEAWEGSLVDVQARHPELEKAVNFLLALAEDKNRERRLKSFLNKIAPFGLDPTMTAMFGASTPGIDWETVVQGKETVLLDFRHELDSERRRLKMLWVLHSFLGYVKRRGVGRHTPIGLIIDELTTLYNFDTQHGNQIFSADLDELINVVARNYRVWLTVCNQELFQLDKKTYKTLMGMGTKIIGVTQDMEAALTLAQELFPYDPRRIKRYDPVFAGPQAQLVDLQPVGWTIQEQQHLAAQLFTRLRPFHFLVKPAQGEGDVTGNLYPLTIQNLDRNIWIDEEAVVQIRTSLLQKSGHALDEILAAVNDRRRQLLALARPPASADVAGQAEVSGQEHNSPPAKKTATPRRAPAKNSEIGRPAVKQANVKPDVIYERDENDLAAFRE